MPQLILGYPVPLGLLGLLGLLGRQQRLERLGPPVHLALRWVQ